MHRRHRCVTAFAIQPVLILVSLAAMCSTAVAQEPPTSSLCTTTVQLPPAPARGAATGPQAGRGGQQGQAAQPTELPRLVKVKDDVTHVEG